MYHLTGKHFEDYTLHVMPLLVPPHFFFFFTTSHSFSFMSHFIAILQLLETRNTPPGIKQDFIRFSAAPRPFLSSFPLHIAKHFLSCQHHLAYLTFTSHWGPITYAPLIQSGSDCVLDVSGGYRLGTFLRKRSSFTP